jgi:excisionase family DNA binding protein
MQQVPNLSKRKWIYEINDTTKKIIEVCIKPQRWKSSSSNIVIPLVKKGKNTETILIPADALRLLVIISSQMAKGSAVTLIPVHAELTTQEAADLLNVSRPFLVNLLEEGKIPFCKVGSRRRVFAKNILRYKEETDKKGLEILEELTNEAQKHNMGYE